jgi:hypothetical protein
MDFLKGINPINIEIKRINIESDKPGFTAIKKTIPIVKLVLDLSDK